MERNVLQTEIIAGAHKRSVHFIPRITLTTKNDASMSIGFKRHQFPFKLAYAMTINKSHGQTFDMVGLFLPQPCFTHGQLYTAESRTISGTSIKILI